MAEGSVVCECVRQLTLHGSTDRTRLGDAACGAVIAVPCVGGKVTGGAGIQSVFPEYFRVINADFPAQVPGGCRTMTGRELPLGREWSTSQYALG